MSMYTILFVPGLNSQVQVPGSRCPDISAIAQGNFLVSWQHDKTTRPWTAAQKMVVRKQLCMNTLISLLLFSIATQLVRFIAGRLLSRPRSSNVAFLVHQRMRKIWNTNLVFSSSVSQCHSRRRPGSMRVSIALVFQTDACFIRRGMKTSFRITLRNHSLDLILDPVWEAISASQEKQECVVVF